MEIVQDITKVDQLGGKFHILHVVNCKGVMGAGVAKAIVNRYPEVYTDYTDHLSRYSDLGINPLGQVNTVDVGGGNFVSNLFAQKNYGTGKSRFLNYEALAQCLQKIGICFSETGHTTYIPYKMGCGLAGGDWRIVKPMIDVYLPDAVICKLGSV